MERTLEIAVARIETLAVDAIVNPANRELIPGAGADGAIRDAAGPALTALLTRHGPLPESGALVTPGFKLPARFVVHTAAPIWTGRGSDDEKIAGLAHCYSACCAVSAEAAIGSLAFPALGTGIYGWPKPLACRIAVETVRAAPRAPQRIVFCCLTEADAVFYREELAR